MAFVVTAIAAVEVISVASIMAVATAVAELGMCLQVAGMVTGSKDLTKVGGYMAMAGGVTSLATGAFSLATAGASAAEEAAALGGSGAPIADAAGASVADAAATGADAASPTSGMGDTGAGSGGNSIAPQDMANEVNSSAPATSIDPAPSSGALPTDGTSSATPNTLATPDAPAPLDAVAPTSPTNVQGGLNSLSPGDSAIGDSNIITPPSGSDSSGLSAWWGRQTDSTKSMIAQTGFKAIGGAFSGWSDDQKLALERNKFALQQQQYETAMVNAHAQPIINFQSQPSGGLISSVRGK